MLEVRRKNSKIVGYNLQEEKRKEKIRKERMKGEVIRRDSDSYNMYCRAV
jgi:hypothetical protein